MKEDEKVIEFLLNKLDKSIRWDSKAVFSKNNIGHKNHLSEHSFYSYKIGKLFNLKEEYCIALLIHDFCEMRYGDISVGKVDDCTQNIVDKIVNISNKKIEKETQKKLFNLIKTKNNSPIENIFNILEVNDFDKQTKIKDYLTKIDLLKDNKIISIKYIKAKQDQEGECFIFDILDKYLKPEKRELFEKAKSLMEDPIVKFLEKAETSFTVLSKNRTDFIKSCFSKTGYDYAVNEYERIKNKTQDFVLLKYYLISKYTGNNNFTLTDEEKKFFENEDSFNEKMKVLEDKIEKFKNERENYNAEAKQELTTVLSSIFQNKTLDISYTCNNEIGSFDKVYNKVLTEKDKPIEYENINILKQPTTHLTGTLIINMNLASPAISKPQKKSFVQDLLLRRQNTTQTYLAI